MSSNEVGRAAARNLNRERDIDDVRNRASIRFQEQRRSKRSAILNQLRQVPVTPKVKKTAAEEKLIRLKAYKSEKLKKMTELKKTQKPPFYSLVKIRHTGSTPFRDTESERKPKAAMKPLALNLATYTRSRATSQKPFEFKATLQDGQSNLQNPVSRFVPMQEGRTVARQNPKRTVLATNSTRNDITAASTSNGIKKQPLQQNNKLQKPAPQKKVVIAPDTKTKPMVATRQNSKRTALTTTLTRNDKAVLSTSNGIKKQPPQQNNKLQKTAPKKKIIIPPATKSKPMVKSKENSSNMNKENTVPSNKNLRRNPPRAAATKGKNAAGPKPIPKVALPLLPNNKKDIQNQNFIPQVKSEGGGHSEDNSREEVTQTENNAGPATNSSDEPLEPNRGTAFHRVRLQNEINRLTQEAETWTKKRENDIPEHIKDEILAVVGQTKLLLAERFRKFKGLIDKCESDQEKETLKITLEDLEGYWDVMYQQVDQLDRRFRSLGELENNNWLEKTNTVIKKKKTAPKKKSAAKPVASKFKDFLKAREAQQNMTEEVKAINIITPSVAPEKAKDPVEESSLYMSASRGEETDFENTLPDPLKTPRKTPAIQKILENSRRRSSIALITLRQTHLMKIASSPIPSPQC